MTSCLFVVMVLMLRAAMSLSAEGIIREEDERQTIFTKFKGSSMIKHMIKSMEVKDPIECVWQCLEHPSCQSINVQTQGNPRHLCELNNDTLVSLPACNQSRPGYNYYQPAVLTKDTDPCLSSPCKNGAVCTTDICDGTDYRYHCINCNNSLNSGQNCDGWSVPVSSCKDIYEKTSHRTNMAYTFPIQGQQTDVYCHMTEITGCGTGGWTLTMKIDGAKNTFKYSSSYWSNKIAYNVKAGQTGFNHEETKMPSYWAVSFSTICMGFRVNGVTNFASLSYTATSLYDVIAPGTVKTGSFLAKSKWQSLVSGSSLQSKCNKEGFNWKIVRIGIVSNNEDDCISLDSYIGHGGETVACCNRCIFHCNNGVKVVTGLGYILVK